MRKAIGILCMLLFLTTRPFPVQERAEALVQKAKIGTTKVREVIAGKVRVYNETTQPLFVAVYGYSLLTSRASRVSEVKVIEPNSTVDLKRMPFSPTKGERIIVAAHKEDLKKELHIGDLNKLLVGTIGNYLSLYIAPDKKGTIKIFTPLQWNVLYPLAASMQNVSFWNFIKEDKSEVKKQLATKKYPARATVTEKTTLSEGEQAYLKKRLPRAKQALEDMLDMSLEDDEMPRIAFCCSGGGYRAMLATLGWFKGAQQIGLLNATLWAATLSGSAWFLAPWITSALPLNKFQEQLYPRIETNLRKASINIPQFQEALLKKYVFGQPISPADTYGALLTEKLLRGFAQDPYKITLAGQAQRIATGNYPYPIYTAILSEREYGWMEFTPHVVGSDYLKAYIPSWAFGRSFDKGVSLDAAPPQSLGFCMGIWGWVLGADTLDLLDRYSVLLPPLLEDIIISAAKQMRLAKRRPLAVPVLNYTKGMQGPYGLKDKLYLFDAGADFNIPLPPALKRERSVDVIVILDASTLVGGKNRAFKIAMDKVSKQFYRLPKIDYQEVDARDKGCLVFKNIDPLGPTIIYLPLVKNEEYSTTFDPDQIIKNKEFLRTGNLQYTKNQASTLIGLAEFNMNEAREPIIDALKHKVAIKKRLKEGNAITIAV